MELAGLAAMASGSPAWAQSDDFNRANAPTLGTNWTQRLGSSGINNNAAFGSVGNTGSVATYNGASANQISFDLAINGTPFDAIGAATFGYNSSATNGGSYYYIRAQADGTGKIVSYGFYTGTNSINTNGNFGQTGSFKNTTASSGHFDFSFSGTVATIDYTPNGGVKESYKLDYKFTPANQSAGIAFAGSASPSIDNFVARLAVAPSAPEPATWSLMILGFGIAGGALRRQRRAADTGSVAAHA